MAIKGLSEGLNIGPDFASSVALLAIQGNPNPLATTFDMNYVDQHNFLIEHDGSLSRNDAYFGNDYSFNQGITTLFWVTTERQKSRLSSPHRWLVNIVLRPRKRPI